MSFRVNPLGSAAVLALIAIAAVGFQTPAEKNGVVDISGLVEKSDFGKSIRDNLNKMRTSREEVLSFIDENRVLTMEQAIRLRDLTLKPDKSANDSAQLDTLKQEIITANRKWKELATKGNLTLEDRNQIQEYADRAQKMSELGQRWVRDFTNDIDEWLEKQKSDGSTRARDAITEVAKAQGFTMVYDKAFAPYSSNDLTDAALTAMNAKK